MNQHDHLIMGIMVYYPLKIVKKSLKSFITENIRNCGNPCFHKGFPYILAKYLAKIVQFGYNNSTKKGVVKNGKVVAKPTNPYQDRVQIAKSLFGILPTKKYAIYTPCTPYSVQKIHHLYTIYPQNRKRIWEITVKPT